MNYIYAIIEKLDSIEKKLDDKLGDRWLTTQDVVRLTRLSQSTIHRAITRGELKVSKARGKNLFRKSWIDKWLGGGK